MSRKSRRHRHLSRSKRKKLRKGFPTPTQPSATVPQPPVASQAQEAAPLAEAPPVKAPTPRPTPTPVQSPYVATELKMIGIISGIMLAILIALAFILP